MIASAAKGLPPEKIGEAVRTALTTAKPKTRYTVAPNPMQQLMTSHAAQAHPWTADRAPHGADTAGKMSEVSLCALWPDIYRWPPK